MTIRPLVETISLVMFPHTHMQAIETCRIETTARENFVVHTDRFNIRIQIKIKLAYLA